MYLQVGLRLNPWLFGILFNEKTVHDISYICRQYRTKDITWVHLIKVESSGCIDLLVKTQGKIDRKVIEETVKEILDVALRQYNILPLFRNAYKFSVIRGNYTTKKKAMYGIKRYRNLVYQRNRMSMGNDTVRYLNAIRTISKYLTKDNIYKEMDHLSMWIKGETGLFESVREFLLNNHLLMYRTLELTHSNYQQVMREISASPGFKRILMIQNYEKLMKSLDRRTAFDLSNFEDHVFIIQTNLSETDLNHKFHLIVGGDEEKPEIVEKTIIDEALIEINQLIGLNRVKETLKEIVVLAYINKKYHKEKEVIGNHFAFLGNSGTGKTMVARLLSSSFNKIGLLEKNKTLEVDRSHLVGQYVGHTAQMTSKVLRASKGGILFIDEAYSLCGEGKDFGLESINTIVKYMEDHRSEFSLVMAGYGNEMQNLFNMNPGLKGRINHHIIFDDYSSEELTKIFEQMAKESGFDLEVSLLESLYSYLESIKIEGQDENANGRYIRSTFEQMKRAYALRLMTCNFDEKLLNKLTCEDLQEVIKSKDINERAFVHKRLAGFVR